MRKRIIADRVFLLIELKRKRAFKKFTYRGIDLDQYVQTRYSNFSGTTHFFLPETAPIIFFPAILQARF